MENITTLEQIENIEQNEKVIEYLKSSNNLFTDNNEVDKNKKIIGLNYFLTIFCEEIRKVLKQVIKNSNENCIEEKQIIALILKKIINTCKVYNFIKLEEIITEYFEYQSKFNLINDKITSKDKKENKKIEEELLKYINKKIETSKNINKEEKYFILNKIALYNSRFIYLENNYLDKFINEYKELFDIVIDEDNKIDGFIENKIDIIEKNKKYNNDKMLSDFRKSVLNELLEASKKYKFSNLKEKLEKDLEIVNELALINNDFINDNQEKENNLKNFINKSIKNEEKDIQKSIIQNFFEVSIKNNFTELANYIYDNYKQLLNINVRYIYNTKSLLDIAFQNNNIELSKKLLNDQSIELENKDLFYCNTILQDEELVKLLYNKFIEKKIDINEECKCKEYSCLAPIGYAFEKNNINLLKFLHKFQEFKYIPNENYCLLCAIDNNNYEIIEFALNDLNKENLEKTGNSEKKWINEIKTSGITLLSKACSNFNFKIAELLKSYGAEDKEENYCSNYTSLKLKFFKKWDYENNNIICEEIVKNKNNIILYEVKQIYKENYFKEKNKNNYFSTSRLLDNKEIVYFIGNKTFTAIVDRKSNIKFDFTNLEGMTSIDFEREINKILNSFEKVDNFNTYLSWIPLALIEFKKQEKQKENKDKQNNNEIEFFDVHGNINKIKEIIDNDLKNKEDKIFVCDFGFSFNELKEDINDVKNKKFREKYENCGHAIPLVIFNSNNNNGNPKTKILAFNTGFKSKKAFEKLKKELGDDAEIIKIDKDLFQKYDSCNISPKPMVEALFASFINELKEDESLVDKLEQYSQDMIMLKKLRKLRKKYKKIKNKHGILSIIKNIIGFTNLSYKEERKKIFEKINLEKFLERLQKYKEINVRLVRDYPLLYSNGGIYVENKKNKETDDNNIKIENIENKNEQNKILQKLKLINPVLKIKNPLNEDLNNSIKDVSELIEENKIQSLLDSIY